MAMGTSISASTKKTTTRLMTLLTRKGNDMERTQDNAKSTLQWLIIDQDISESRAREIMHDYQREFYRLMRTCASNREIAQHLAELDAK